MISNKYGGTKCRKNCQNANKNSTVGNCFLQRSHMTPATHALGPC